MIPMESKTLDPSTTVFHNGILIATCSKHSTDEPLFKRLVYLVQSLEQARLDQMNKQFPHDPKIDGNPEKRWFEADSEKCKLKERRKFWALDIGTSGAFLIEKKTGEIFNLKSKYGVPDYNKKKKADLGNVFMEKVTGEYLITRTHNYLR